MNAISNKKIAIVGGGPGGLTLARLLQIKGADVQVYERDKNRDARDQGATLDLHEESGLAALKEAGLMDEFRASYRPGAEKMRVTDEHANIMHDEHGIDEGEIARPEIDRGPLKRILIGSLQPGTVVWDSQFTALTPDGSSWRLEFKNGASAIADIVIAADGANSKIRPYITPIRPFYSGITVLEGIVYQSEIAAPAVHALLGGGKIFAMGDKKSLVVSSKGDGSLVFYNGFGADEAWAADSGIDFADRAQVLGWFKKEYAGWSDIWLELFERAALPFTPRPQYCMPIDQDWEALPNLTMIGDAAHLMPPYAGEGVNMAMQDALELSRQLTGNRHADTHQAIAAYEQQMRARASETAQQTMDNTAALHDDGAVEYLLGVIS